jgi:hypothetical protein
VKSKDILDAMNNIDNKFINEAYPSKGVITMEKNNLSKNKKFMIPVAACLALVAVGTILISTTGGKNENNSLANAPESTIGEVTTSVTDVTKPAVTVVDFAAEDGIILPLTDEQRAQLEARLVQCEEQLVAVQNEIDKNQEKIKAITGGIDNVDELDETQKAELEELQNWNLSLKTEFDRVWVEIQDTKKLLEATSTTNIITDESKCIPTVLTSYEENGNTVVINDVATLEDLAFFRKTPIYNADGEQIGEDIEINACSSPYTETIENWDLTTEEGKAAVNAYYEQNVFPEYIPAGFSATAESYNQNGETSMLPLSRNAKVMYSPGTHRGEETADYTPNYYKDIYDTNSIYDSNSFLYLNKDTNALMGVDVQKHYGPYSEYKGEFVNFATSEINGTTCTIYSHEYTPEEIEDSPSYEGTRAYYAWFNKYDETSNTFCTYHIFINSTSQEEFMNVLNSYLS